MWQRVVLDMHNLSALDESVLYLESGFQSPMVPLPSVLPFWF